MAESGQAMTPASSLPPQLTRMFNERTLRQFGLIIGLAAAIAAGIGLFVWAQEPLYRPLFSGLSDQDAGQVMSALQSAQVPHKLDPNTGAILVPADQVHQVRLQLAADGLPRSGGLGFEMLQQDQGFGTSQFMENARFQRALETELARSISSLRSVESARVHLAVPKRSVFVRDQSEPSASVLVNLFPGRSLNDGQVASIVHLVASSVPGLVEDKVTLVDQNGRLLTNRDGGALGGSTQQLEYRQNLESAYVRRIEALLTPMLGNGRVRAQVNAELDFSSLESTEEIYDPNGAVVRSEQTSEQRTQQALAAEGVPGALTNQPPQAGTLEPGEGTESDTTHLNVNSTRNYEIGRTVRHLREQPGQIERLSVAVLVDQKRVLDEEGNVTREPLSAEEIAQIEGLVREAIGVDAARGDSINVISAPFQLEEGEVEPAEVPLMEQPWVWQAGKLALAALVGIVLILAVIRPLMQGLLGAKPGKRESSEEEAGAPQLTGTDAERPQLPGTAAGAQGAPQLAYAQAGGIPTSYEETLTAARSVVSQEPALAANLVKNWLTEDE